MSDTRPEGRWSSLLPSRDPVPELPSDRLDPRLVAGIALGLLALHALLAWLGRPPGITTGQDNALYMTLARSLREGLGYRELYEVSQPLHTRYPPFYPAVLAAWGWVFGEGTAGVAALNIAASAATLGLAFLAVRRIATPTAALACLAALAVNPYLVARPGTGYSEPLFALLAVAALYLALARPDRTAAVAATGAAAILAALTRSIGVTLIAALAVHWALSRRWRAAAGFTAAATLTVGAWLAWTFTARQQLVGDSYLADATFVGDASGAGTAGGDGAASALAGAAGVAAAVGRRMVEHGAEYVGIVLPWHLPMPSVEGTPVDNALVAVGLALALLAGIVVLFRSWRAAALYLLAYGLLLAYWPWRMGRFLEPLLPLLVPAVVLGAAALARSWVGRRAALAAGGLTALAIVVAGGYRTADFVARRGACSSQDAGAGAAACMTADQESYFRALDWIRRNAPDDAVVLAAKPQPLYWHTGRRTVDALEVRSVPASSFYPYLDEKGVDYVLLGSLRALEVSAYPDRLRRECRRLQPVERFPPRTWLFRLEPAPEAAGATTADDGASAGAGCRALERFRELNEGRAFDESLLFYPSTAGPLLRL